MSTDPIAPSTDLSRRNLLHLAFAGGGVLLAAAIPSPGVASGRVAKKAVQYQDTPKGKLRCDNCRQWEAPAACKLVDGPISPAGWCMIYAPKA